MPRAVINIEVTLIKEMIMTTEDLGKKRPQTPKETAFNKILDAATKEESKKVDNQVKLTVDAYKAFKAEKEKLEDLLADTAQRKDELKEIFTEI